jgi:hypothetical protein
MRTKSREKSPETQKRREISLKEVNLKPICDYSGD